MSELIQVVKVVEAVQRIPPDVKVTFFSRYDLWMYTAVLDDKLCDDCLEHEKTPRYFGTELRTKFPYLEIVDANTILAKVHPHCRYTLTRIIEWTADDLKWFIGYAGD